MTIPVTSALINLIGQDNISRVADRAGRNTEKSLQRIEKQGKKTSDVVDSITKRFILYRAAAEAGRIVTAGFREALDFEFETTKLVTQIGISEKAMKAFGETIKNTSLTTSIGAAELARAGFAIQSAGIRGAESFQALDAAAKLAAIGLGDAYTTGRNLSSIMQAYAHDNITAAKASDILLGTIREGNLLAPELASAIGRVLPIASQLGVTFSEVGAAIATYTRFGVSASEAVTGVRQALNALNKPGQETVKVLSTIGITMDDLRGMLQERGLIQTLEFLRNNLNNEDFSRALGRVRALNFAFTVTGENLEQANDILAKVRDSAGSTAEAFERVRDTGQNAIDRIKSGFGVLATEIITEFTPVLVGVADLFEGIMTPEIVGRMSGARGMTGRARWDAERQALVDALSERRMSAGAGLSGVAAGAGAGALLGSIIPGVGTILGGAAGGILGGLGAYTLIDQFFQDDDELIMNMTQFGHLLKSNSFDFEKWVEGATRSADAGRRHTASVDSLAEALVAMGIDQDKAIEIADTYAKHVYDAADATYEQREAEKERTRVVELGVDANSRFGATLHTVNTGFLDVNASLTAGIPVWGTYKKKVDEVATAMERLGLADKDSVRKKYSIELELRTKFGGTASSPFAGIGSPFTAALGGQAIGLNPYTPQLFPKEEEIKGGSVAKISSWDEILVGLLQDSVPESVRNQMFAAYQAGGGQITQAQATQQRIAGGSGLLGFEEILKAWEKRQKEAKSFTESKQQAIEEYVAVGSNLYGLTVEATAKNVPGIPNGVALGMWVTEALIAQSDIAAALTKPQLEAAIQRAQKAEQMLGRELGFAVKEDEKPTVGIGQGASLGLSERGQAWKDYQASGGGLSRKEWGRQFGGQYASAAQSDTRYHSYDVVAKQGDDVWIVRTTEAIKNGIIEGMKQVKIEIDGSGSTTMPGAAGL